MSAEFWAGYVSGAAGIIIGNPLDIIKVRLQASPGPARRPPVLSAGAAAPILGYGALNALLFETYTRTLHALSATPGSLADVWLAGAAGGLATWAISTPTELVKCRAQVHGEGSAAAARRVWRAGGIRGLYAGGAATAARDALGYGVYFAAYEGLRRWLSSGSAAVDTLVCGGAAGVASWVSVFPADVVKTRVQAGGGGTVEVVRAAWREGGMRVFWRGVGVCSVRGFVVNAVTWGVYEWMMGRLKEGDGLEAGDV